QDGAVLRVVLRDECLVRLEPHRRRHVVLLGLADERVNDQAVADFERELGEVLVRAMNRVARLEAGDALPPEAGDALAQLARREAVLGERARGGRGGERYSATGSPPASGSPFPGPAPSRVGRPRRYATPGCAGSSVP